MHIYCLGLNHLTASVALREKLAFDDDQIRAALSRLGCGETANSIREMVILATCNRVEIYAIAAHPVFDDLETFLTATHHVPRAEIAPHLFRLSDGEATRHLLTVAAGLDSLVLGEPQILGQVTHALELARGQAAVGPILSRLFQAAIHTGKRARTETSISRNPASVSSLAAGLAEKAVPHIKQAQIVVLGAGEMAELAVEALRKRGASHVLVVNRTRERARALAQRWGGETATFENLAEALTCADILIASTGAPHTLVQTKLVAAVMQARPRRPLVMIDIAVPRDVDPAAGEVPGVRLYDMDHLNHHLQESLGERAAEVPRVEAILNEEIARFDEYIAALDVLPLIADLSERAEAIRQVEL